MTSKDLNAHLFGSGPKRILALDGGGIRGILTVQLLGQRVEGVLNGETTGWAQAIRAAGASDRADREDVTGGMTASPG